MSMRAKVTRVRVPSPATGRQLVSSNISTPAADASLVPALRIRGASKMLGNWRALNSVDLDLGAGEILVLLGPNGAGKSTLLAAACGRIGLDAGGVELCGSNPRLVPGIRRKLGFVPQHLAVYPYLTVRENLEVFGRIMAVPRKILDERVDEALAWADLEDRASHRSENLSGGMLRRLNIVASLLHHPDVVLLDEPTVGVDMDARERIHEMLRGLRSRGLSMLLTTHDLTQAEDLADRVLVMVSGEVRMEGRPDQLIRDEFKDMQELKIVLRGRPNADGRILLRDLDLRPDKSSTTWTGPVDGDLAHVGELTDQLSMAGLAASEVRVREPSLEGVLLRLTGEELSA